MPGLIERARLLLACGDWEGAAAAAEQLLKADAHNVTGISILGAYFHSYQPCLQVRFPRF